MNSTHQPPETTSSHLRIPQRSSPAPDRPRSWRYCCGPSAARRCCPSNLKQARLVDRSTLDNSLARPVDITPPTSLRRSIRDFESPVLKLDAKWSWRKYHWRGKPSVFCYSTFAIETRFYQVTIQRQTLGKRSKCKIHVLNKPTQKNLEKKQKKTKDILKSSKTTSSIQKEIPTQHNTYPLPSTLHSKKP